MNSRVPFFFLAWLLALPALGAQNFSLCSKTEINYSSCRIGKKIASFCLSGEVNKNGGYLQYRFGTKEKIELSFPERTNQRASFFESSDFGFTDGDVRYTAFVIGPHRYIYYQTHIKSTAKTEGRLEHGLAIVKNGVTIKDMSCSSVSDGLSGPKSKLLHYPEGMFVEEKFVPW